MHVEVSVQMSLRGEILHCVSINIILCLDLKLSHVLLQNRKSKYFNQHSVDMH